MKEIGLLFLLIFLFSSCSAETDNDFDYSKNGINLNRTSEYVAIFGDIQYYTNAIYNHLYKYSCNWILSQKLSGVNINCVLHTGDLTQSDTGGLWKYFLSATQELASEVPYFSMIGDHDYTWSDGIYIDDRNNTQFNEYVQFPLSIDKVAAWYEEGRMENTIIKNYIHGVPVYLLILEFGPRKEVVEWADLYVKTHPNINFILMTHEYLEMGGGRRSNNLKSQIRLRNTTYLTPDELWNKLVKCNNNIICILCGHVGGLYALTVEANNYGREIPQIQHNIQSSAYRYDNWLMLWEFPKNIDSVNVSIINTKSLVYFEDKPILFKFKYRFDNQPMPVTKTTYTHSEDMIIFDLNGRKVQNSHGSSGILVKNRKKLILH